MVDSSFELLPEQFLINPSLPIYEQFVEAIRGRIVSGIIPPGSRLPSVRDLAAGRGVNPTTAARTYQELERMGLIVTYRGQGTFVTQEARVISEARRAIVQQAVRQFTEIAVETNRFPEQPAEAPAAVECHDLRFTVKNKTILDGISFHIPQGSITGLLGPNGAGKSSLLRIIAGLAPAGAGSVLINGKPAGIERLGELSMLPDRSSLPGWLTVREWLGFAAGIYPDWDAHKAAELLLSLSVSMDSRISTMSRGEEARLQLLTCLSRRAALIILDEPFTGVDLISREVIASAVVGELADGTRTFLIATHDIREMELLFDRLILIGGGRIRSVEDVEQLRMSDRSVESRYREVFA
ncbi:hypothetical protein KC345_g10321 [Hortaea werneckii]|nr:hypothetical protein KC345_g10321 [Hortaea werneckii]